MTSNSQSGSNCMRLQKFLARAGVASRRKCEELIAEGRVSVNGSVIREMGATVDPALDEVAFDGIVQTIPKERVVIMLNKPMGYLTAMEDAREKTVAELVPVDQYPGLFPIGRLDKDTTGLLLFTNDGELGHQLLHPSHHVDKRYIATVEGRLSKNDIIAMEQGVMLEDGMTAPAQCRVVAYDEKRNLSTVALTIHEGRKRQVRRMLKSVGHEVKALHRDTFGPLDIGDLAAGKWRVLTEDETNKLTASSSALHHS